MITVRIICQYCGSDNYCGVPIGTLESVNVFRCKVCEGHLFDIQDIKNID